MQKGHLDNIKRLSDEGKLVVAGPFWEKKDSNFEGLFIFNVETTKEEAILTELDPTIKSGSLAMKLYP